MFLFNNFLLGRRSDGYVKLLPDNRGLVIDATLDYPYKVIGKQSTEFVFDYDDVVQSRKRFVDNIARSRTFGTLKEWEWLKRHGMGRGANENNVIAISANGDTVLNKLYYRDEFVRHKIIDAIGDLYLSGGRIVGRLESYKGSHAMNNLALRKLFSDPANYDIV
jgi:UDP-3-O-[3-hydroxymyristoyl] N-acetylglucosamine deacetylase